MRRANPPRRSWGTRRRQMPAALLHTGVLPETRRRVQMSMGADFEADERWCQRLRLGSSLPWFGVRPGWLRDTAAFQRVARWHITRYGGRASPTAGTVWRRTTRTEEAGSGDRHAHVIRGDLRQRRGRGGRLSARQDAPHRGRRPAWSWCCPVRGRRGGLLAGTTAGGAILGAVAGHAAAGMSATTSRNSVSTWTSPTAAVVRCDSAADRKGEAHGCCLRSTD
jgi:hypothetical protein